MRGYVFAIDTLTLHNSTQPMHRILHSNPFLRRLLLRRINPLVQIHPRLRRRNGDGANQVGKLRLIRRPRRLHPEDSGNLPNRLRTAAGTKQNKTRVSQQPKTIE